MSHDSIQSDPAFPIAVGGVGGSGTRVVADILGELGYYLGGDLNHQKDNLWYTLLFKRRGVLTSSPDQIEMLAAAFSSAMSGRQCDDSEILETIDKLAIEERYGHDLPWLAKRSKSLKAALRNDQVIQDWAWKEPNTHVLVERLAEHIPGLRYIHVIRDGLDMAFSPNKNQLHYWADSLFHMSGFDPEEPGAALHYWRLANERIVRLGQTTSLPILEVGFECLCKKTVEQVRAIAEFCDRAISGERARDIGARTVRTPKSLGRHRRRDLSSLDADDCRYARETNSRLARALEIRASKEPNMA